MPPSVPRSSPVTRGGSPARRSPGPASSPDSSASREQHAWIAWGTLLVTVGVFMVFVWPWFEIHHARLAVITVLFGAVPMLFFVAGFVSSIGLSAVASSSPVGAYGTIALFHLHTAVKMIDNGAWDRRRPDGCWERRHLNRRGPGIDGGRGDGHRTPPPPR
jgi:hypothetical protein